MRSPFFIVVLACCAALRATAQSTPAPFSTTPKLTGYLQPRFEVHGDTAVFFLRRARFALEGNVTPWASYRAQVEMRTAGAAATPAASPLSLSATDLWVKATHGGWGATVGQFRVPFALESLLSSTTLETTERSLIVNAAKRDIGVQGEWRIPDRVTLQGAVVNGEGPNRATNPDNRMAYFARAIVTPVKGLDVGGAFEGYSDLSGVGAQGMYGGRGGRRGRSISTSTIAEPTCIRPDGTRWRRTRWCRATPSSSHASSSTTRVTRSQPTGRRGISRACSTSGAATT